MSVIFGHYVVVGGTGTLGRALTKNLLQGIGCRVTCVSRDELKQKELKAEIGDNRLQCIIGDVRDKQSLQRAFDGAHAVFHVAALKHIDVVEDNPIEGVKTNVLGTVNVAEAAIQACVPHVVFSSTDKAVEPVNIYGMTKAISEKYLFDLNRQQAQTRFSVFRWGNVLGSRGSVIHHFIEAIKNDVPLKITDERMTRFWLHIDDAARYMLSTYRKAPKDRPCIPEMKGSSILDLAHATARILDKSFSWQRVGMRPGEKLAEVILADGEKRIASDNCPQYSPEELRELVRPLVEGAL